MEIKDVTVKKESYNGNVTALNNVSLNFNTRVSVVFGEPGSGKTTLIETIAGLEKPCQGKIEIKGNKIFLMQVPERQFLYTNCRMEICGNKRDNGDVKDLLSVTGLPEDILEMSPWSLSRGEKKRLSLTRILKQDIVEHEENIFFLDDPFADLDGAGKKIVMERIINREKFKIIMTTSSKQDLEYLHNEGIKFKLLKLNKGKIIA